MDRLNAMKMFTRVVDTGSFTKAADTLRAPRASVSTTIQALERHLNIRLLQRTTRRLNLTPEGAEYYDAAVRILEDVEEIEGSFASANGSHTGHLRIDVPGLIGSKVLLPQLDEFQRRFPGIQLLIGFSDRPVDLIQEGVDCVIRVGPLQDSSLVARKIGTFQGVTVASPQYLARHGTPKTIDELRDHVGVLYFSPLTGRIHDLTFNRGDELVEVKMNGNVAVNDAEAQLNSTLRGNGIMQNARFMALPFLKTGQLVEVLPDVLPPSAPISVVYPHNRHLSPKVRAFADWAAEIFSRCPLLNGVSDAEIEDLYFPRDALSQSSTVEASICPATHLT